MLKLRQFSLSDLNEIQKIEKTSFPSRIAYSKNYFRKIYQKFPKCFIVAKEGKKILGYAIGQLRKFSGELISIAVNEKWRRKKIGTKLLKFVLAEFKKMKARRIMIQVREGNAAAVVFYRKFGFRILKKLRNYYRNGDNAFLMKKRLGA